MSEGQSTAAPAVDSRAGFSAALLWGFQSAIERGARRIVCVDPDWSDWPLDDAALHDRLVGWLRLPQRRLVLLAGHYDEMPRRHARFVAWRRSWIHAIEAWAPAEGAEIELPTLLLDDTGVVVHLVERRHWRGEAVVDTRTGGAWRDRIDAVLQRCEPAFAASHLGL